MLDCCNPGLASAVKRVQPPLIVLVLNHKKRSKGEGNPQQQNESNRNLSRPSAKNFHGILCKKEGILCKKETVLLLFRTAGKSNGRWGLDIKNDAPGLAKAETPVAFPSKIARMGQTIRSWLLIGVVKRYSWKIELGPSVEFGPDAGITCAGAYPRL